MHSAIYLASNSPRRRELLRQIGVNFEVLLFRGGARADTDVDEAVQPGEDAETYVCRVAQAKAAGGIDRVLRRGLPHRPVLAADTTLAVDADIVGKPADAEDAARILRRLSDREHRVLTAVVVTDGERTEQALNISTVRFGPLTPDMIRRYVASGEPMDKAGAYGIQGRAGAFVQHIEGSYTGIMGLPLYETARVLECFGIVPR
ncbi:septum formation inhibitor Maf [Nitrogeniibacter mangrovi]|uniref:dTTP/UTP pyrophosphatase n=1 Tax=Nitrogeniibacter mangrovi TaxID=2016596 RepID=A0A6C1AZ51_9RHOO|nr:Maf family protein [Nitrogeniibacter mangrovi]QID16632.1 septum formation inhibitor Maf [Nitrogeniibacter mangrovi]